MWTKNDIYWTDIAHVKEPCDTVLFSSSSPYMWRCDSSSALYLAKHTHITFVVRVETTYFSTRTCTFSHCISFPTLCIETTKYTQRKRLMLSSPIELFRLKFQPKISKTKKNNHSHSQQSHTGGLCYEWNSKHKQIDIYMSVRNSNSCWYVHFRYFCAHQRKLMCIFQFDSWM